MHTRHTTETIKEVQVSNISSTSDKKVYYYELTYDSLDSTMIKAKEIAEKGAVDRTVIIARMQKRGMGRNNRKWFSPIGGLWMSIILRPKIEARKLFIFSYLISLSIAEAIKRLGIDPKIKWPNDILIDGKKVAGVLIDSKTNDTEIEYIIAGIGINVNNKSPKHLNNAIEAISIREKINRNTDIELLKRYLYTSLEKNYSILEKSEHYDEILRKWDYFNFLKGRTVRIYNSDFTDFKIGKVKGIDFDTGYLVVEVDSKRLELLFDSSTIRI